MNDASKPEMALLVSDGQGSYYAIPRIDLERYRVSPAAAADVAREAAPDTSGFLLRQSWERPPVPQPALAEPSPPGGLDASAPGFVLAVPITALRRLR